MMLACSNLQIFFKKKNAKSRCHINLTNGCKKEEKQYITKIRGRRVILKRFEIEFFSFKYNIKILG